MLVSLIWLGIQDILMGHSISTSIDFRYREIALIMVFYSMPRNKAEDQFLTLQHSEILWQPDMQNWWASVLLLLSFDCLVSMGSLGESLAKDFQLNRPPCPWQQMCEIYAVWTFRKLSKRGWWSNSLWCHVPFMRPWDMTDDFLERRGLTSSSINSSFF